MAELNFPKIGSKKGMHPVFTAKDAVRITNKNELERMPKAAILTYSDILEKKLRDELGLVNYSLPFVSHFQQYLHLTPFIDKENSVLVFKLGIGAPVTAVMADDLIAVGVDRIMILGSAGGIGKGLALGDTVLCTKSLRDEGTSHHYIENSMFSEPDSGMADALAKEMTGAGIPFERGPSWTTDTPYVETAEEVKKYLEMGILTVEMESAALFAVAESRGAKAGAVFMVSDLLNGQEWTGMREHALDEGHARLAKVARIFRKLKN